jgi:hypothetical protein
MPDLPWRDIATALSALGGASGLAWLGYLLNVFGMQDRLWKRRLQVEEADKRVALREKDVALVGKGVVIASQQGEITSLRLIAENLKLLGGPEMKARVEDLTERLAISDRQRQADTDGARGQDRLIAVLTKSVEERGVMINEALAMVRSLTQPPMQLSAGQEDDAVQKAIKAALSPDE